jgi:thioesterase domain-containing protein
VKYTPATSTIDTLTAIWKRVLQLSAVGVDDNFFDIGGDSSLALELFNEIALTCGCELPPVTIYHAPTIAALAQLIEHPTASRVPPIVQLKAGSDPPVFIAHGLGGSVIDFYQVVKYIDTPRAIYGLQAKGIDGVDEPFDRIEDMARFSLDAVRELQPHGPYSLVGFSLGGLVTLEMAQQLVALGEKIGLLAMLDSYPHMSRLSRKQRARLGAQQIWRRISAKLQWLGLSPPYQTTVDTTPSPTLQHFRECSYRALELYEPRFYPGQIHFVRAAIPTDFPADPVPVWSPLANTFQLDTVPGDHLGIMTTHFRQLANVISHYLTDTEV